MGIETQTIPPSLLKPGVYAELNPYTGSAGLPANIQKLLLVAQRLSTGSVAQGVLQQVFTEADAATYWGAGSVAHLMVARALAVSQDFPLIVIGMDDAAASAAATATLTLTAAAAGAGTLTLWIGSRRVDVGVVAGDDAAALATRVRSAINAIVSLPVTAAGTAGAVLLTAKNKGTIGNQLVLRAVNTASGVTLSAAKVAFTGGATDPDIKAVALDIAYPSQFHVIAIQSNLQADILKLKTHVESASSAVEMREGRGVAAASPTDTLSATTTATTAINHERVSVAYARGSYSTGYELAASVGAVMAAQPDPARPFNGVVLPGIALPDVADRLTRTEQEALLSAGATPIEVIGQDCTIVRLVTTKTSINGAPDVTLLDTGAIASLDYLRSAWRNRMRTKFPQPKNNEATRRSIKEQTIDVMKRLESQEILQDVDAYKDRVDVQNDPNMPGRARVAIPAPVVRGLHQLYARIDLINI